jgi:hypothetical protein
MLHSQTILYHFDTTCHFQDAILKATRDITNNIFTPDSQSKFIKAALSYGDTNGWSKVLTALSDESLTLLL